MESGPGARRGDFKPAAPPRNRLSKMRLDLFISYIGIVPSIAFVKYAIGVIVKLFIAASRASIFVALASVLTWAHITCSFDCGCVVDMYIKVVEIESIIEVP